MLLSPTEVDSLKGGDFGVVSSSENDFEGDSETVQHLQFRCADIFSF